MEDAHKMFANIPPGKMQELMERFNIAIDNHIESKSAAANYVADGAIVVGAVASWFSRLEQIHLC